METTIQGLGFRVIITVATLITVITLRFLLLRAYGPGNAPKVL